MVGNGRSDAVLSQAALGIPVFTLGIRPEHLDEKQALALSLAVDVTERLGSTSYVHGALPSGETVLAERRDNQPGFGETITPRFQPARARVFVAEETRIR